MNPSVTRVFTPARRGKPATTVVSLHLETAMTINEGTTDRILRLVAAAAAVLIGWWAGFGSVAGIILLVVAGWMFVTGAVGVCPGYGLVKTSTRPSPHRISAPPLRAVTHH